jgi:GT2 family glycosyltransferase
VTGTHGDPGRSAPDTTPRGSSFGRALEAARTTEPARGQDVEVARPRVGITILNYENAEDVEVCLASVAALEYEPPLDICVVDNGSSAACVAHLESVIRKHEGVRLLRNERNVGYAAGNNTGIQWLLDRGAAYVLVLNDDSSLPPDFLGPLVDAMEADPLAALAMPRFLDGAGHDTTNYFRRRPTYASYFTDSGVILTLRRLARRLRGENPDVAPVSITGEPRPIEVPCGACMLLRAEFLEAIGLLDEGTFLYQEEVILTEQTQRLGLRMLLVPESIAMHLGGRTTRHFPLRRTIMLWRSQDYYLKAYRGVGPLGRGLLMAYNIGSYPIQRLATALRAAVQRTGKGPHANG